MPGTHPSPCRSASPGPGCSRGPGGTSHGAHRARAPARVRRVWARRPAPGTANSKTFCAGGGVQRSTSASAAASSAAAAAASFSALSAMSTRPREPARVSADRSSAIVRARLAAAAAGAALQAASCFLPSAIAHSNCRHSELRARDQTLSSAVLPIFCLRRRRPFSWQREPAALSTAVWLTGPSPLPARMALTSRVTALRDNPSHSSLAAVSTSRPVCACTCGGARVRRAGQVDRRACPSQRMLHAVPISPCHTSHSAHTCPPV
mmetsp:Transcript_13464/g.39834  ORF Transcript_13464/g.39834 Transcript_13464/m.39834 type:complete len:264 (-) Transcript_13464:147-938(-)